MGKNRNEQANRGPDEADKPTHSDRGVYQSGVVDKALVERARRISDPDRWLAGEDPPWSIVERYLSSGEYREEIEEHKRRSRAFADVLEALRNDEEERDDGPEIEGAGALSAADLHEPPRSRGKLPCRLRLVH
jgi:hypothetical protein